MPPGAAVAQHGVAIVQSIMQLSGQAQHGATLKHGFMHGSMTFIGQSTMAAATSVLFFGEIGMQAL